MWLATLRSKFWEERNPGKRYSFLRIAKNRIEEFKGQYSQEKVDARTNVSSSKIRQFESGGVELIPEAVEVLIKDLGITMEQFNSLIPPREAAKGVTAQAPAAPVFLTMGVGPAPRVGLVIPPKPEPVRPAVTTNEEKSAKITAVVNHTEYPFVVKIEGSEILIFEDKPENMKKGTWAAGADLMFDGTKIRPRTTRL